MVDPLGLFPVPRTGKMGLHHFSHFGVDEPPPFGPMRYHNRIACCDAFAILECGRINFPTCIAYPPNTDGDCDIVREMRFIHIGYVDGRHEPTHTFVTRRSEAHTSELQSIMRISYAVFGLQKKNESSELKLQP